MTVPQHSERVEHPSGATLETLRARSANGTSHTSEVVSLSLYLAHVMFEVRHAGYSMVWPPTWFRAWERLHTRLPGALELQDSLRAREVLAWIRTFDPTELTSELDTARELIKIGRIDRAWAPFAASLAAAYARVVQRRLRLLAATSDALRGTISTYLGKIGRRSEFDFMVLRLEPLHSIWGGVLVLFRDSSGNVAKWIASRVPDELRPGMTVRVRATVVAHHEQGGVCQTVLTRIKVHGTTLPPSPIRSLGDFEDADLFA